jgi:hypothetical protein
MVGKLGCKLAYSFTSIFPKEADNSLAVLGLSHKTAKDAAAIRVVIQFRARDLRLARIKTQNAAVS